MATSTPARTRPARQAPLVAPVPTRRSATVEPASLAEALCAFQAETPTFLKTKTARVRPKSGAGEYAYKYADLGTILPVLGPLLAKHGLSWSSKPGRDENGELVLRYRLLHVSGESDWDEMPLGVPRDCKPQELGSAITYARRYALTAQLNLATDEDDDGAAASEPAPAPGAQPNGRPSAAPAKPTERRITGAQRDKLLIPAAEKAGLSAAAFANLILAASGVPARTWESEKHAEQTLDRLLDQMPMRLKDPVLERIAASANGGAS